MALPATVVTSREQEYSGLPSISTMQAPHCSVPQPNLVPRRLSSSRSTDSSGAVPSALTETGRPLTTKLYSSLTPASFPAYCSTLMPLASMNFDQFLISFSSLTRSAGPGANDGSVSTLASRSRRTGFAMVSWMAFCSLALIGSGVPLGTKTPHQNSSATSAVVTPRSPFSVGTSGIDGERFSLVTAMALTSLPSCWALATGRADTTTETNPPATAAAAGPPPLNGTGTACMPAPSRMTSAARCDTLPGPAWP